MNPNSTPDFALPESPPASEESAHPEIVERPDLPADLVSGPAGPARLEDTPFLRALRGSAVTPADPLLYLAYRRLLEEFEAMIAEEQRTWQGDDPEGAHQMRVAIRRLRAALRVFGDVLPRRLARLANREFQRVARVIGAVRDLDVYRENLSRYAREIPEEETELLGAYNVYLQEQWESARRELLACLSGRRYQRLKTRFATFLERGPSPGALARFRAPTIADAARTLIRKRYKRVLRRGRALQPDS
ncbi:MAG TPA: CHAD domain-containing protein, partial [Terriglobia bacterium]|nr:CHAD domain-containing protein [Terriglobia bacterium]